MCDPSKLSLLLRAVCKSLRNTETEEGPQPIPDGGR